MKILVTGGAGFIGSHTVVELNKAGYKPVVIDNFSNSEKSVINQIEKLIEQPLKTYTGDYQDKKLLKNIFRKEKIKGVIHFAAYKAVGESVEKPLAYYLNNVAGLVYLLEAMEENNIANLVFSSSCTVYGEPDKLPVSEESSLKPATSPYGATKQMCEVIIQDTAFASERLKALALRYFNPIGAHPSGLIGELPLGVPANLVPFVTQAAAGIRTKLTVNGNNYPTPDGTCVRDYIHITDLAKAHVKALAYLTKERQGYYDVFNVGTGKGTSVLKVIKTFEKVNKQKVPYVIGPRRAGDVVTNYAAVAKSAKVLGWKAEKNLDEALRDAWRWQQTLLKRV
jgi:UDP-glucose 4-epimerase